MRYGACPNAACLLGCLQKSYLGNLLKMKIIEPHPLTFPCRSNMKLKNMYFFLLKNKQCMVKRCRKLYGERNSLSSILHPFSFPFQRQSLLQVFCVLFWTYTLYLQTHMYGGVGHAVLHLAFVALQHLLNIF